MSQVLNGVSPLPHLGVLRAEGEDAARFLQGQLTQDFALLGASEGRLAAFCTPKGRMQASFVGFKRSPTEILLVMSRDILAATLKRLSMFVLRAKARLSDATADYRLYGIAGTVGERVVARPGRRLVACADGRRRPDRAVSGRRPAALPVGGLRRNSRRPPGPRCRTSSGCGAKSAAASRRSRPRSSRLLCRRCSITNRWAASISRRAAIRARKSSRAASFAAP